MAGPRGYLFTPASRRSFLGAILRASPDALPNEGEIAKLGGQLLLPGTPVEAYLRTDDCTPLAYLVKPLADYFSRAFRE